MKFDISKVYTAVNAAELKVGSKVLVADSLSELRGKVELDAQSEVLLGIEPDNRVYRFRVSYARSALAYLVEAPSKLKWTDLKVGDILEKDNVIAMVTLIDVDHEIHVHINSCPMSDAVLKRWRKVE